MDIKTPDCIDIISDTEAFNSARHDWESVYEIDPEGQIYLSWVWLSQLYQRRTDEEIFVLAYRSGRNERQYDAFLPLRKKVVYDRSLKHFINVLSMAGNDWADYTGIICDPIDEEKALKAFSEVLIQGPWNKIKLSCLRFTDQRGKMFFSHFNQKHFRISDEESFDNNGETDLSICPSIELPKTFDDYLAEKVKSNTRQKIRRYMRKLESDSDYGIRQSTPDTQIDDLNKLALYWCRKYRSIKGNSTYNQANKYHQIVEQGISSGQIALMVLTYKNKPVALHAYYIDKKNATLRFFVGAREQSLKFPIGLLLHAYAIEWAIENKMTHYDLMRGNEPYKYSLGAKDKRIRTILVERKKTSIRSKILDESCVILTLKLLEKISERLEPVQVEKLFSQLLDSWPADNRVLNAYATWLRLSGQSEPAANIEEHVTGLTQPVCLDTSKSFCGSWTY